MDDIQNNCVEITSPEGIIPPPGIWTPEELSVAELLKVEPPPVRQLVTGVIPEAVVGVLLAEGGLTKSFAAERLCVDLAVANPENNVSCKWLDKLEINNPAKTLYLHLEDQEEDLQRRLWKIRESISFCGFGTIPTLPEVTQAIIKNLFFLRRETFFSSDNETFINEAGKGSFKYDKLLRTCEFFKPKLVIVDTRTKASRVDENKTDLCAAEIETWTRFRDTTGATVLLLAHTNKISRLNGADLGGAALRGAGSYADNVRLLIAFRSKGQDDDNKPIIEISNPKNTRIKCFDKFDVVFHYPKYLLHTNAMEEDIYSQVIKYVREHPGCKQYQANKDLKKKTGTINSIFKTATADGDLIKRKDGYYVAE